MASLASTQFTLAVIASVCVLSSSHTDVAVVDVDLLASSFVPGKAGYERVRARLTVINNPQPCLVSWQLRGPKSP